MKRSRPRPPSIKLMKFDIRYFESVGSTMDIARDEAASGAAEGLVIQAGEQVSGRGRRGNQWISPKGNLYQSILLRPERPRAEWGQLSFVIAVALLKSLEEIKCHETINLKWPNDVLVQEKKISGILLEAGDGYIIPGIGVNIEHAPEDRSKISDFSNISVDGFRDLFLDQIGRYYDLWQAEGFAQIRDLWLSHAYKMDQVIQARLPNVIYEGVFKGIDAQGNLLLQEKDGSLRTVHSGEILHVPGD